MNCMTTPHILILERSIFLVKSFSDLGILNESNSMTINHSSSLLKNTNSPGSEIFQIRCRIVLN